MQENDMFYMAVWLGSIALLVLFIMGASRKR
jgi:hypothetical protein